MLRRMEDLIGFSVTATDGKVRQVKDVLFDDEKWTVRHLVLDVGGLLGRRVLVSPICITSVDQDERTVRLSLSREEVEAAPNLESAVQVSRAFETDYYDHFGWPYYWTGPYGWGLWSVPPPSLRERDPMAPAPGASEADEAVQTVSQEQHLRSFNEVNGYSVELTDGRMGDVEDMVVDVETWKVRYVVVDTSKLLPSKDVLVPPEAASRISFAESTVHLDMTKEQLSALPAFKSVAEIRNTGDGDVVVLDKG